MYYRKILDEMILVCNHCPLVVCYDDKFRNERHATNIRASSGVLELYSRKKRIHTTYEGKVLTHRLCTLVSVAFRFNRREFGFPGSPYMIAKLIELLSEI